MTPTRFAALACLGPALVAALAACDSARADPLAALGTGIEWHISAIAGQPVPEGVSATLTHTAEGMLAGSSGCNRYTGKVEAADGKLTLGPIAGTRMMCAPAQMTVETAFLAALPKVTGAKADGDALTLTDSTGTVLITARK